MRGVLLGIASTLAVGAFIVPAAPAQAQFVAGSGASTQSSGVFVDSRTDHRALDCDFRRGHRGDRHDGRDRRDRRRVCNVFLGDSFVDAEWALYNNRSWESDSYNDWWHDQPWRSYPRWLQENRNCERMWWAGGGWRC